MGHLWQLRLSRTLSQLVGAHQELLAELLDVVAEHAVGAVGLQTGRVHRTPVVPRTEISLEWANAAIVLAPLTEQEALETEVQQ